MNKNEIPKQEEYQYGFHDEDVSVYKTKKGLSRDTVIEISRIKKEPQWMLERRLQAYDAFCEMPIQEWGPDVRDINFDEYTYYIKPSEQGKQSWEEVPETIKNTFDKLGIPEAEAKYLSGVTTQYESEAVYHNMLDEVKEKGIIFLDTDSALKQYPDLFQKYFGKLVSYRDNKFAALNSCVW